MLLGGVTNHGKQAERLRLAVYRPTGVENLVATMLGIRLGKHHQLDVGGIASGIAWCGEVFQQVINFVVTQRQTELLVGFNQRITATTQHVHSQ